MSAWSEWKCGAITYDDYRFACMLEEALDKYDDSINGEEDEEEEDE